MATVISSGNPLCVPDLSQDDRFRTNPLVEAEPNIRFYAGAPLITPNGQAVGTICSVEFSEKRNICKSARGTQKIVKTGDDPARITQDIN